MSEISFTCFFSLVATSPLQELEVRGASTSSLSYTFPAPCTISGRDSLQITQLIQIFAHPSLLSITPDMKDHDVIAQGILFRTQFHT